MKGINEESLQRETKLSRSLKPKLRTSDDAGDMTYPFISSPNEHIYDRCMLLLSQTYVYFII